MPLAPWGSHCRLHVGLVKMSSKRAWGRESCLITSHNTHTADNTDVTILTAQVHPVWDDTLGDDTWFQVIIFVPLHKAMH